MSPPLETLSRSFYLQSTRQVARQLLGKILCVRYRGRIKRLMIVETEAYLGVRDRACHSYGGRRTPRVEVMYKKGGHSYVYFIYGMYHCLNVVTRGENRPEAVLIRALYDPNDVDPRRYAGPGKLCKALRITKTHNAIDFVSNRLLTIKKDGSAVRNLPMVCTKRVGVESYGKAADAKLRYYLKGHPAVSRR